MRLLTTSVVVGVVAIAPTVRAQGSIDAKSLSADTRFLAADLLRGRETGSPGHEISAEYVISRCIALGLEPVGGSFSQRVPMIRAVIAGTTSRLTSAGTVAEFSNALIPGYLGSNTPLTFSGPLIGADLQTGETTGGESFGAIAVVGTPVRFSRVADSLATAGFVGVVQLTSNPEYFRLLGRNRGPTRMYLSDPRVPSAFAGTIPIVTAAPELTDEVLRAMRTGGRLDVTIDATTEAFTSPNVACRLSGADTSANRAAVALSAHLDHLGVGEPDDSGDSIYNGFSDDAAGAAMLLEIARVLSLRPRLTVSVVFLFFTGEERGLLGSEYMARHPVWPADRLVGLVNLDAGAPPAPPARWEVVAGDSSELGAAALAVAASHGWGVRTSAARPNSDFFPFFRAGTPAIFIIPGSRPYEGLTEVESDLLFRRWDAYHRPDDEWSEGFPFSGMVRYAEYALEVVRAFDERLHP